MKRSEMIKKLAENHLPMGNDTTLWLFECEAEAILTKIEELGMLPPIQNPSLVDDGNGGQKHGPALRVWDKE